MLKLFFANLKMMVRSRQSLFWSLAFPLMFTIIFGFFFGGNGSSVGSAALVNNSQSALAQSFSQTLSKAGVLTVRTDLTEAQARDAMQKSQIGAVVIVPPGFGDASPQAPKVITIVEDPANIQVNSVLVGFINQFLTQTDYQINHIQPTFSINEEKTNSKPLSYFDFVLMGLIGLALMNASVQGVAIVMSNYREDKILKRITTTPLASWKFIAAEVMSRLVLNVVQITFILLVGFYAFGAHIYGSLLLIYLFGLLGGLLFQSIGFTIASIAKNTDAANGMSVAVTIPMMFLAGVFFPTDSLPKWLFSIVQYLPLAPLLRMMRQIGLEQTSPLTNPSNIIVVLVWIAVCLTISIRRFRLSDE